MTSPNDILLAVFLVAGLVGFVVLILWDENQKD